MKITGARLVDPDRVGGLADLSAPLPERHDPWLESHSTGLHPRVLAIDVDEAWVGAALTVRVYPVQRRGTVSVACREAGRTRCFVTLQPTIASATELTIDVESEEGDELWADEIQAGSTLEVAAHVIAREIGGAHVEGNSIVIDGPHQTIVEIDPRRVFGKFACHEPTSMVGRNRLTTHPWKPLSWEGSLRWHAEDPSVLGPGTLARFRDRVDLLDAHGSVEVRLHRGEGTIVVAPPRVDMAAAERIVSAILCAIEAAPVPVAGPRRERASTAPPPAALPPRLRVLEGVVVDPRRSQPGLMDPGVPLPPRDDAFHSVDVATNCHARLVIATVDRPVDCPQVILDVCVDGDLVGRAVVPEGAGPTRVHCPVVVARFDQTSVDVTLRFSTTTLWHRSIFVGPTSDVLLDELAHGLPGAERRGDEVVVSGRVRSSFRFWCHGLPSSSRPVGGDPLVRFINRLRGVTMGAYEVFDSNEPFGLEVVVDRLQPRAKLVGSLPGFCTAHVREDGRISLLCSVRRMDVAEVSELAKAILHALG